MDNIDVGNRFRPGNSTCRISHVSLRWNHTMNTRDTHQSHDCCPELDSGTSSTEGPLHITQHALRNSRDYTEVWSQTLLFLLDHHMSHDLKTGNIDKERCPQYLVESIIRKQIVQNSRLRKQYDHRHQCMYEMFINHRLCGHCLRIWLTEKFWCPMVPHKPFHINHVNKEADAATVIESTRLRKSPGIDLAEIKYRCVIK